MILIFTFLIAMTTANQNEVCSHKYQLFLTQNMTTESKICFCRHELGIYTADFEGIPCLQRVKTGAVGINLILLPYKIVAVVPITVL